MRSIPQAAGLIWVSVAVFTWGSLRRAAPQLGTWELQADPNSGVQLSPTVDGYRLCGTRPGQYTVLLQHRFGTRDSQASALHWPVQTDISAI